MPGSPGVERCAAWVATSLAALILTVGPGLLEAAPTAVKTVSYSMGASGSRLKWLPIQAPEADRAVPAAATEPLSGPGPKAVQRAGGDALTDPFEDLKAKASPAAPAKPDSTSSEKSTVMPSLGDALPKLPVGPAKSADTAPKVVQPTEGPTIEQQLQVTVAPKIEECPEPQEALRSIRKKNILDDITPKPGPFPQWCLMGKEAYTPRSWSPTNFHWTASALCHKPVYFEDLQLERYGHTCGPWYQPIVSGGHFFLSVPVLPYAMGLFPPNECIYTLGYYRPGSCAPQMLDALPMSIRAILAQGGVWTGMAFLIP